MIVVDRPKLKFLLAGRKIIVEVGREYRKGRDYAVGTSWKRSVCRARVEVVEELEDGWRLTLAQVIEEKPRWFARQGVQADYTFEIAKAVLDEPEPLDDVTLRRFAADASERDAERRQDAARSAALLRPSTRLARLEREPGVSRELRVIGQRIERAERQARSAK